MNRIIDIIEDGKSMQNMITGLSLWVGGVTPDPPVLYDMNNMDTFHAFETIIDGIMKLKRESDEA